MAFDLAFTTQDYNQGKSILIVDNSTDWASVPAVDEVRFTIKSLYSSVVIGTTPLFQVIIPVLEPTVMFAAGFQYEIEASDIWPGSTDTIPNSIYEIKMDLYNGGLQVAGADNTYTSNEVFYYDAMALRDAFIAEIASYNTSVNNKQMEYANWLDFLVTSIESNSALGNSSAVYYTFDTFNNLSE